MKLLTTHSTHYYQISNPSSFSNRKISLFNDFFVLLSKRYHEDDVHAVVKNVRPDSCRFSIR